MKKGIFIGIMTLAIASQALAAPMGPVRPMKNRLSLEYEMGLDRRDFEWVGDRRDKSNTENFYYLARLSYSPFERAELFVRLGGSSMDVVDISDATDAGNLGASISLDGNASFAWGGGASYILAQWNQDRWSLATQGNYLAVNKFDGVWTDNTGNNELDYWEWNAGLQLQRQYDMLLPYVGIKVSNARLNDYKTDGVRNSPFRHDAPDHVGLYGGVGFDLTRHLSGYVEARFVDESSAGFGLRYSF